MSVGKNTGYNLVGAILPMILGLISVPLYLKLIGPERYGILSLAWLILGYFGVFDLGLGRAATQRIAALRDASPDERATAFGTALTCNILVGLIGAGIIWPIASLVFARSIAMSPALRAEAVASAPLLALALPVATVMGVLSGALMGREKFLATNRTSVISTTLFQLMPIIVAWWVGPNLRVLLLASLAARLVGLAMFWRHCCDEFGRHAWRRFDRRQMFELLGFGGWVTVGGLFIPLLVMADRFIIGSRLGAVAVTIYTVPTQITSRLSPIAGALCNALFPRFATASTVEADRLTANGLMVLFAMLTPCVAFGLGIMAPALHLWLGAEIGDPAGPIGRIMLLTAWLNVFGQVPFARIQATGFPETVAKANMAEVPFYLGLLWFLISIAGLEGAALAALVRVFFDTHLMQWLAARRLFNLRGVFGAGTLFAAEELVVRNWQPGLLGSCGIGIGFACLAALLVAFLLPREFSSKALNFLRSAVQLRREAAHE